MVYTVHITLRIQTCHARCAHTGNENCGHETGHEIVGINRTWNIQTFCKLGESQCSILKVPELIYFSGQIVIVLKWKANNVGAKYK